MPRYYAEDQWQQIDQNVEDVTHYVDKEVVVFDKVVNGDTLLVLAVRHDTFRAAQRIVELGVDVLARNVKGESVVAMLDEVRCAAESTIVEKSLTQPRLVWQAYDRSHVLLTEVARLAEQARGRARAPRFL